MHFVTRKRNKHKSKVRSLVNLDFAITKRINHIFVASKHLPLTFIFTFSSLLSTIVKHFKNMSLAISNYLIWSNDITFASHYFYSGCHSFFLFPYSRVVQCKKERERYRFIKMFGIMKMYMLFIGMYLKISFNFKELYLEYVTLAYPLEKKSKISGNFIKTPRNVIYIWQNYIYKPVDSKRLNQKSKAHHKLCTELPTPRSFIEHLKYLQVYFLSLSCLWSFDDMVF